MTPEEVDAVHGIVSREWVGVWIPAQDVCSV